MKIEWKYAPDWASEVRRAPNGELAWVGTDEGKGSVAVVRVNYIKTGEPAYQMPGAHVHEWPLVCTRGEDADLKKDLVHVHTVNGHKLYAESKEAGEAIKRAFEAQTNAVVDAEMSLRDEFAAAVLKGMIGRWSGTSTDIAKECYKMADQMLAERNKK